MKRAISSIGYVLLSIFGPFVLFLVMLFADVWVPIAKGWLWLEKRGRLMSMVFEEMIEWVI